MTVTIKIYADDYHKFMRGEEVLFATNEVLAMIEVTLKPENLLMTYDSTKMFGAKFEQPKVQLI